HGYDRLVPGRRRQDLRLLQRQRDRAERRGPGVLLPPGASGSLLRSVAFFDGNAAGTPALTLTVWAVLGLAAVLVGSRRAGATPGTPGAPARTREPAAA
ncbi:hypothetical protein AB0R12_14230, partial [Streptomyces niveus]